MLVTKLKSSLWVVVFCPICVYWPIWDAHMRKEQYLVPYKYFICMFYFFTDFDYCYYKSITRDLQMKAQCVKPGSQNLQVMYHVREPHN